MAEATTTVRVAMIGAGVMANRVHYPSLDSFPDVEMAAICDLDPERLGTTADRYGVEKLLGETPAAVYLSPGVPSGIIKPA